MVGHGDRDSNGLEKSQGEDKSDDSGSSDSEGSEEGGRVKIGDKLFENVGHEGKSKGRGSLGKSAQELVDDPALLRELIENDSPELPTMIDELKETR